MKKPSLQFVVPAAAVLAAAMVLFGPSERGSADGEEAAWLDRYGDKIASVFVQRPLSRTERRHVAADGLAGLEQVIRGWQDEDGAAEAARVFVQSLLAVSGKLGPVNGDLPGNLAAKIARTGSPWSEIVTATGCVGDDGDEAVCDTGAPFAAGVLTTRGFLLGKKGRFNLHRANTMLSAFSCRQFPLEPSLEPKAAVADLIPMFGQEESDGEDFGNGNKCYSCHGQFAHHAQLFVKFDADGVYAEDATGIQDPALQSGESAGGLYASHFQDESRSAAESSQYLGKEVDNLAGAAAVLAKSDGFLACSIEKLIVFTLGLGDTEQERPDADLTARLAKSLRDREEEPTFLDLAATAFTAPEIMAAARGVTHE